MATNSFGKYQTESRKTWSLIHTDHAIVYPTLGLVNEAGEVAGKIKKIFRDKEGVIAEEDRAALKDELGDVLWYLTVRWVAHLDGALGSASLYSPLSGHGSWIFRRSTTLPKLERAEETKHGSKGRKSESHKKTCLPRPDPHG